MRQIIRALAFAAALLPGFAAAQVPQFPQTLPANTVIGRLGTGAGPTQAIPFSVLMANIGASRTINTTAPLAGGGTLAVDRTLSITANGIDNTLIRQSGALTLIGRAANSTGNVADIPATPGSSCAFVESASTLICGQIATAGIANNAVDNTKIRQSGALTLVGRSANSTGNVADISATPASSCVFMENASTLACTTIATASITNNAVTFAKFQQIAALSMFGNCTNATANGAAVTGIANQVLRVNGAGTSCGFGAVDLSQSASVTNTLPFTNLPTLPADNVAANPTGSTAIMQALALVNCSNALTYSTSTHTFGCNSTAGTGTVTSAQISAGTGIAVATTSGANPCTSACNLTVSQSLTNATLQSTGTTPTGTTSATQVMLGLGVSLCRIAPVYSTRLKIEVVGYASNSGTNITAAQLRYGTGAGPANGAAPTGTVAGIQIQGTSAVANAQVPFTLGAVVTGLSAGTTYWFDLGFLANGGTSQFQGVSCNAFEF